LTETVLFALAVIIVVFGVSAATKLRRRDSYASYVAGLGESRLVAGRALTVTAAVLAAGEALVALCAVVAAVFLVAAHRAPAGLPMVGLAAAVVLTGILTVGVAMVLRRGTRARCACFGSSAARPLGPPHLVRNAVMLAVAIIGLAASVAGTADIPVGASIVALAGGGVVGLLAVHLDELVDLFAASPASNRATR
jgi:hypothetical protein